MALTQLNRALTEFRGTIDGFTYRMTPEGKVCVYAHSPSEKAPSDSQVSGRRSFAAAQYYAKRVLADPLQRIVYQSIAKARKRPTNTILVANYLNAPTIEFVELAGYSGAANHPFGIIATDDIDVAQVSVEIRSADDTVLESGDAKAQHGVWRYHTTTTLPAGTIWRVAVTAANRAGHRAILTVPDPHNPASGAPILRTEPPRD